MENYCERLNWHQFPCKLEAQPGQFQGRLTFLFDFSWLQTEYDYLKHRYDYYAIIIIIIIIFIVFIFIFNFIIIIIIISILFSLETGQHLNFTIPPQHILKLASYAWVPQHAGLIPDLNCTVPPQQILKLAS